LIPNHIAWDGKTELSVGDEIELETGDRMREGVKLHQDNFMFDGIWEDGNYSEEMLDEDFVTRKTKKYTVCGFYEKPEFESYSAAGYTAIIADSVETSDNHVAYIYFEMKKLKDIYNFMDSFELNGSTNFELLMFSGVSQYKGFYGMVNGVISVLIILIMFGSVSLIYNAFAISVSERTRQFGILSSVGATKKQLRHMVFFEAFFVSAIGIPLGIAVGFIGIGITLHNLGGKISGVLGVDFPMKMIISPVAAISACVVALLTVLISALIPSVRATHITAVEAIRQSRDIKSKNKPIKTPRIVYRLFGASGMLAQKYFRRSRKKYRSTILGLFMSIVLFISASAFSEYVVSAIDQPSFRGVQYDIIYEDYSDGKEKIESDETFEMLTSEENITDAVYMSEISITGTIDEKYLTEEAVERYRKAGSSEMYANIIFLNDEAFKELLRDNNIDEKKFMNADNPLGVAFDGNSVFDVEKQKYVLLHEISGDECEMEITKIREKIYSFTIKTAGTITKKPFWFSQNFGFAFVFPYSMIEKVFPYDIINSRVSYLLKSDNHEKSFENITEMIKGKDIKYYRLFNQAKENEKERNIVTIIRVFAYGFIVLISLISAANVFNTVSTNVILRRRDFAMLKSVGMTDREFHRMLNYECIMYGTKSLVFGLPVSFVMTWFIHIAIYSGIENNFFIPWKAVGIAVLSVFAVVFATMIYTSEKIKDDNIIETLKNENI
ncbi:MAG: ABC transporter permease, partial [Ruminococcus sp.]|nr:ABC transporter permease [Ruminococcus sp.]